MTTVTLDLRLPGGAVPKRAVVAARLIAAEGGAEAIGFRTASDEEIAGTQYFRPDATGLVTMELVPNAEIVPANTRYELAVTVEDRRQAPIKIAVPDSGTYDVYDLLDAGPVDLDTSGAAPASAKFLVTEAHGSLANEVVVGTAPGGELGGTWGSPVVDAVHSGSSHAATQAAAEATARAYTDQEMADHEADEDPHPQYLTPSEGSLTYDPLGASGLARAAAEDYADTLAAALQAALDAHLADTTGVHGIADTLNLALTTRSRADGAAATLFRVNSDAPHGPHQLLTFDGLFGVIRDPVIALGYNYGQGGTQFLAGEPFGALVIEGDYWDGSARLLEMYLEYRSPDNLTNLRPFSAVINRATHAAVVGLDFNGGQLNIQSGATQVARFEPSGLTLRASKIISWPDSGARQLMTARNFGNTATGVVLQVDANNKLAFGDTNFAGVQFGSSLDVQVSVGSGWQAAGRSYGGANADASGVTAEWRGNSPASPRGGLRVYAGRFTGSDIGARLVGLNGSGTEKPYLHLNSEGDAFSLHTSGAERIRGNATGLGFFNAPPVAKPTVTGSRGGNAALDSLLTALANLGLVTNSTSA